MQPEQLKLLTEFDATRPPALLPSPACTLPKARDDRMVPELSPTSPPACRFATFRPPTLPNADEFEIKPWLMPASPPSVVLPPSPSTPPVPGAPVTLPAASELAMTPVLKPTSPPAVPFGPTKTSPIANEEAM